MKKLILLFGLTISSMAFSQSEISKNCQGKTNIIMFADYGDSQGVMCSIENGADINSKNELGPLH